jgi:outer membrane usher protein
MHAGLEASGAIVAVKGAGIFATVPIQNGFAVAQVPGVKGLRVYLDNREVGKTDAKGNLLVPNMVPYYGSRIRISDQDLPLDYSVGGTEQILAPPYRGAAIAVFSAERIRYYRGHIKILRDGVSSVPVYGDITVTKGKKSASSPIGKEGEFELEGLVPGHYTAQISHTSGGCAFTIEAPDDKGMLIDLGSLVCTP